MNKIKKIALGLSGIVAVSCGGVYYHSYIAPARYYASHNYTKLGIATPDVRIDSRGNASGRVEVFPERTIKQIVAAKNEPIEIHIECEDKDGLKGIILYENDKELFKYDNERHKGRWENII